MRKKLINMLISTLTLLLLVVGIDYKTAYATELQPNVTYLTEEDVRETFTRYGVSKENQDALLKKYFNGEMWDSFKKGVEPISIHELQTDEGLLEIKTFPDGSVIASSKLPEITDEDHPFGINKKGFDNGTIIRGSGYVTYKNARVFYDTVAAKAEFYVTFTLVQNGNDFISAVGDEDIFRFGAKISDIKLSIEQATETLDYPAKAQLYWISKLNIIGSGQTCYLWITVGNDRFDVYADIN
ncbi:hypothetical protein [Sporosarcina cyprini]|uniref:hypothetical protein n=1 Tax=Sporosarcina cyprini TaxID=2910523 RepID=UPI001EE046B5|nr:hypothetical protein [Sporosarcina cyprini]MCG3086673.1 hypothetical protein [Sporosarcina cyprini]